MEFNKEKFNTLVHYICWAFKDPNELQINWILWYSDIMAYLNFGESITGATYVRRQFGPAPRQLSEAISDLQRENMIAIRRGSEFLGPDAYVSLVGHARLKLFTADEMSIIHAVISNIEKRMSPTFSVKTDLDAAWEEADIGEEIPLYSVLAAKLGEINEDDIAWARRVVASKER